MGDEVEATARVEKISAITLFVSQMARSVAFYESLGFRVIYGGPEAPFTSMTAGPASYLNIAELKDRAPQTRWGRVIFYVADVDAQYRVALERGYQPDFEPRDAVWGERYFHLKDPDGHELSFARPLEGKQKKE